MNYEDPKAKWSNIWMTDPETDPKLVTIHSDDPNVIPILVIVNPSRDEELTEEDYEDDVHERLMSCDGMQHEELMNWEPIDYSFTVDNLSRRHFHTK